VWQVIHLGHLANFGQIAPGGWHTLAGYVQFTADQKRLVGHDR
jgi:hypothetical protein